MSGFASDIGSSATAGEDALSKALADGVQLNGGEGEEADGDDDDEDAAEGNDPLGSAEAKKKKKKKPKKKKKVTGDSASAAVPGTVKQPIGEIRESSRLTFFTGNRLHFFRP